MAGMADQTIIDVQTNATALAQVFGELAAEQFPFASAQALTTLAFDAQKAEKAELPHVMKLRNRYSASGIQVNRAEKYDWPNQQAEVGIDKGRSYLIDHVLSAHRQGGSHGRAILELESLRNANGRVPKANKPGTLIKQAGGRDKGGRPKGAKTGQHAAPRPFVIGPTKGWNNEVLVKRMGAERYPLEILYAFKKGVQIKREFEMDIVAQVTISGRYYAAFRKALVRALKTAKPKAERDASRSAGQIIG